MILSGAGISAESGINTFRDSGGLWEKYDINEVATIDAWHKNPSLVLEFYNSRRKQVLNAQPNLAHFKLVELEAYFDVQIITQNIDDLHERAGSTNVLHLHGEILKSRSVSSDKELFAIEQDLKLGDKTEKGEQLRPHIVWFGEEVPAMTQAELMVRSCDILVVIGTSLNVYPAAGLAYICSNHAKKYIIDPQKITTQSDDFIAIQGTAVDSVPSFIEELITNHSK